MAQYDNHATDLYILPDSPEEAHSLVYYLRVDVYKRLGFRIRYQWQTSDVPENPWFGRCFIEIPLGTYLREELEAKFPPSTTGNTNA